MATHGTDRRRPPRSSMKTFRTSLEIQATPGQVFAAISAPERLARWWGPSGFTNTFSVCEFRNGGRWSLVMHAPNGASYPSENIFDEIDPLARVVVVHASEPRFRLTIGLAPSARGTLVTWSQEFADEKVAEALEPIVVPANDQNLARLAAETRRGLVAGE